MGGEKFDTPHPEGYLFGENMDLNFLGNRPVQVGLGRAGHVSGEGEIPAFSHLFTSCKDEWVVSHPQPGRAASWLCAHDVS